MSRAYPAAYRTNTARMYNPPQPGGGFQRPQAANDNFNFGQSRWSPPPQAANDNLPMQRSMAGFKRMSRIGSLLRLGTRFAGWLGLALFLWDLWEQYNKWAGLRTPDLNNWVPYGYAVTTNCGLPVSMISDFEGWPFCSTGWVIFSPGGGITEPNGLPGTIWGWTNVRPRPGVPGQYLADSSKKWQRFDFGSIPRVTIPIGNPMPIEVYRPVDPFYVPIRVPVPNPIPLPWILIPYRTTNPNLSPTEQSQRGYISPGSSTGLNSRARPRTRPRKREKEKKIVSRSRVLISMFQRYIHHPTTEALDVIDAIYEALPKAYRPSRERPQDKLKAIYQHWDKIDIERAILNLVVNHIVDEGMGRLLGGAQNEADRRNIVLGLVGMGV